VIGSALVIAFTAREAVLDPSATEFLEFYPT
jgi:hypothetical protein